MTQKGFADRLRELMEYKPDFNSEDVDLVAIGRHFFAHRSLGEGGLDDVQIILGRNQEENEILASVASQGDTLISPENFIGPLALVRQISRSQTARDLPESAVEEAKAKIIQFSPKAKDLKPEEIRFKIVRE